VRFLLAGLWRYGRWSAVENCLRQDWVAAWLPAEALAELPGLAAARWKELDDAGRLAHAADFDLLGEAALAIAGRLSPPESESLKLVAAAQYFRLVARKPALQDAGTPSEAKAEAARDIRELWPRLRRCASHLYWDPAFVLVSGLAEDRKAAPGDAERSAAVREAWSVFEPLLGVWQAGLDGAELTEFKDELERVRSLLQP
jgi:hypothetical protein